MCLSEQGRLGKKKWKEIHSLSGGKGFISVLSAHTALLCMEQLFVKSSKPMKNATSSLFEERIIVTYFECENYVPYFENRNACALCILRAKLCCWLKCWLRQRSYCRTQLVINFPGCVCVGKWRTWSCPCPLEIPCQRMCDKWRLLPSLSKRLCAGQHFSVNDKYVKGTREATSDN